MVIKRVGINQSGPALEPFPWNTRPDLDTRVDPSFSLFCSFHLSSLHTILVLSAPLSYRTMVSRGNATALSPAEQLSAARHLHAASVRQCAHPTPQYRHVSLKTGPHRAMVSRLGRVGPLALDFDHYLNTAEHGESERRTTSSRIHTTS